MAEVPFRSETIRMFGRPVAVPRLVSWHGDPGASYVYSGTPHEPLPWTPALAVLRDRTAATAGVAFNSVLANLYRTGRDSMGWHADDEPELGPDPVIASLSLGAARRFRVRARNGNETGEYRLSGGSLLVTGPGVQAAWQHCVPREAGVTGARINLTFRRIVQPRR
jgi:alkylated DNA repair dioxygenase AlkB